MLERENTVQLRTFDVHLVGLVTENKLIKMHRGSNFKFGGTVG